MATVYVNNQPVDIGNERLNLIQAAKKAGVDISALSKMLGPMPGSAKASVPAEEKSVS